MHNKGPTFSEGISFQLAKIGIILVFVLSFSMSLGQIYLDYHAQSREFDKLVDRVIQVATPPAARAVHTLDDDLAAEVVNGLFNYDFIYEVAIHDERGNILAESIRTPIEHTSGWLIKTIDNNLLQYTAELVVPGGIQYSTGKISLRVDKRQALQSFYSRSELNLVTGVLRNLALVVLLFIAFYVKLTKPLARLSQEINTIDPDQPGVKRLTPLPGPRKDELARVISSANQLLDVVELSLTKRRAIELTLRKSEEHLRQIVDSLPVLIGARNKQGYYLFANHALADALGYTPEQMCTTHVRSLLKHSVDNIDQVLANDARVIDNCEELDLIEEGFVRADGNQLFLQTHMIPLDYYDEVVSLVLSVDVTERKTAQEKMQYMAHHDALTSLPNRLQLVERLEHEVRRAKRHGYFGAVLFIDLDKFKNINDSLGHPVGDLVLQEVARRLKHTVREEDLVARLSGDEFIVVLTVLDHTLDVAALKAGEVGEKIRTVVSQPIKHDKMELRITCSVGVVVYPDKNNIVDELLRYADTAMYHVKEKGRDSIEFFNKDMADKVSAQLIMEADLHKALEQQQFVLYYQPKLDVASGEVVGAEALLRWMHPEKGQVSPMDFIPVLETSGLIIEVGRWVIEQACQSLKDWTAKGLWGPAMTLSVNVSPRQFRGASFVPDVISALQRYDVPAGALDIEITEGIIIQRVDEAIDIMSTLAAHHVSFSLDDFGTGYSSISYLKRLPVSTLKIDKSFVQDLSHDRNDRVLVETIITMARLLDLNVVAEGVETAEQLEILNIYNCHTYQGFYFSPAVPAVQFEAFLKPKS
ncbi:putative bifunctional diguanylate cyclase/phosphodiesterase [Gilvimarinus polysaccharolyticus]|uniref:putative bifunctional diguanylate cyclase/phosphodiesterase n=1 Tax=Gilvimarinus polysaccharolyticus TaxID=863921 RepID=UPI0006735B68|nr:EAL domain-containing protein [Gilvimarinus polysaccharolyticus]